jgi:hypothetical protein
MKLSVTDADISMARNGNHNLLVFIIKPMIKQLLGIIIFCLSHPGNQQSNQTVIMFFLQGMGGGDC